MFKKALLFLGLVLSFSMLLGFDTTKASAEEVAVVPVKEIRGTESEITPMFINDYRTRKVNVSYSYEWSGYRRVSDNLDTRNSSGGSITSNRTTTFTTAVSGSIAGLGINTSASVSSQVGYTMNVGPGKLVYLGYKVYYKVEKGTRQTYDSLTGQVISSNAYTVKVPQYGTYALLNY